jgi:chromosome segregation ATPase
MEAQDINYLIQKYSRTPSARTGEEVRLTHRSEFSPFREPNSKAYAAAMRALQERIRFLESENTELFEKYKGFEQKYQEQRFLNEKLSQELGQMGSIEGRSTQVIAELRNELSNAKRENAALVNRAKLGGNEEIDEVYRENLKLKQDLDVTMRDLSIKKAAEVTANMYIQKLEQEKGFLQEELSREKWKNSQIQADNSEFKHTLDKLRVKELNENELQRQNQHFERTIRELEDKCRSLEEGSKSKSQSARKKSPTMRRNRTKGKISPSLSPSPTRNRPKNRHIGAHLLEFGDFGDRVQRLEGELEELNKKYRKLLFSSKNESNGLEKLKQGMDVLAEELENKGQAIYKLKKQHEVQKKSF